MASEKKVVLVFTSCNGKGLATAETPAIARLKRKGALFTNVSAEGDIRTLAATGACGGETLWEAATARGFIVAGLKEAFDMCVLEAGDLPGDVECVLAEVLDVVSRSTLIVVIAPGMLLFYGPGIAKGKVVEDAVSPACVGATVPYVADFPVPSQCSAPVAYAALKDINFKLDEMRRMQETVTNMEAAMERKSRRPWDKHDCA